MITPPPLFLYVGKLPKSTLAKVEAAGYVAIPVTALDQCQIMQPLPTLDGTTGAHIATAAAKTIKEYPNDLARSNFASNLLAMVDTDAPKAK